MAKRTCVNGHVTKDDKALKCSQCGADLPVVPKRSKLPLILGIFGVLVICGIIGALSGGDKDATTTQPTDQAAPAQAAEVKQTEVVAKAPAATRTPVPTKTPVPLPVIGDDVKVGDITWKVLTAENLGQVLKSNNQFIDDVKTSGSFVSVRYQVTNGGTAATYYTAPDLLDSTERKFSSSSNVLFFIPDDEQCIFEELNPGISKTCQAVYEVPADAKGLTAKVTGLSLFGGDEQVDLGLDK
jgi:hypothetical protein